MSSDDVVNPDEIKAGDRITILPETRCWSYSDYEGGSLGRPNYETGERTVVEIVGVKNFLTLASPEALLPVVREMENADRELWPDRQHKNVHDNTRFLLSWLADKNPRPNTRPVAFQKSAALKEAVEEARLDAIKQFGENPRFVMWGTPHDRRVALVDEVRKVADKSQYAIPAAPKKTEKPIAKRNLMVEKSKWRFTHDVEITKWVHNPKIDKLIGQRQAIRRSPHSQHQRGNTMVVVLGGGNSNTASEETQIKAIQAQIEKLLKEEPDIKITVGTIPAGMEFTVTGKISSDGSYGPHKSNGLQVPVEITKGIIDGDSKFPVGSRMYLPYKQIEQAVEAEYIPETIVWVIRDTRTGDFFAGWESERDNYGSTHMTNDPKMSSTFSGSKKYKTSSAAKASVRDFTGYNSGLEDEGGAAEWVGIGYARKKIDLPESWELVGIDKTTGEEKKVEDLQKWYAELMRLRVLTQNHGSAVREVFKKGEGKGFDAILLFKADEPFDDYNGNAKALMQKIDGSVKNFGTKPLKGKSAASVAFACMMDDAYLGKLSFSDSDLETKIFNFNTLEEIVKEDNA